MIGMNLADAGFLWYNKLIYFVMAFDTDGFCFPLLTGVRFDGYDKSIVRIVGGLLIPVSPGTTRVTVHWHNFSDSFVVTVTE